uniref:Uncharacterized protein n=1 Tax=Hyaloperonospora arabidopsidis (strain Emoy2) TaxID=559515 RepID=M4BT31_HYAAE
MAPELLNIEPTVLEITLQDVLIPLGGPSDGSVVYKFKELFEDGDTRTLDVAHGEIPKSSGWRTVRWLLQVWKK